MYWLHTQLSFKWTEHSGKKSLIFHVCITCFIVLVSILKRSVTCELERECTGGVCGEGRYCLCLSSWSLSQFCWGRDGIWKAKETSKLLGFHCKVGENCPLVGYYATSSGYFLLMFWGNILVLSSKIKIHGSLEIGLIGCPETSVRNYLYLLHNKPEKGSFLLKRLNSPGIDHIPAVLIKAGGRTLRYETNTLNNSICLKQELPEQWKDLIIVPMYEMGNKTDCRNYIAISLLLSRLTTYAE